MGSKNLFSTRDRNRFYEFYHYYLVQCKKKLYQPNFCTFTRYLIQKYPEFGDYTTKQLNNKLIAYRNKEGKEIWPNLSEVENYIYPEASLLLKNSQSAILAAIELHNKPIFPYRYETTTILVINAWELLMKAYIKNNLPKEKLYHEGRSIEFEKCLNLLRCSLGKEFYSELANLRLLYKLRCDFIHFYNDNIDQVLFSLLSQSVLFFCEFIKKHFNIDFSEKNDMILLPIGFKTILNPVEFISSKAGSSEISSELKNLLNRMINWTKALDRLKVEKGILYDINVCLLNTNSSKNADILAKIVPEAETSLSINKVIENLNISNDGVNVTIEEERLIRECYIYSYDKLRSRIKEKFPEFKTDIRFHNIKNHKIQGNNKYHYLRYHDPVGKKGARSFYSEEAVDEIIRLYIME